VPIGYTTPGVADVLSSSLTAAALIGCQLAPRIVSVHRMVVYAYTMAYTGNDGVLRSSVSL